MGLFERYLSLWVGLCILVGVLFSNLLPHLFAVISRLNLPTLTWLSLLRILRAIS